MSRVPELQERVTQKFAEIAAKHKNEMRCGLGCHECCKPGLTVSRGEAHLIKTLLETSGKREELKALAVENPHRGKRCAFLNAQGACSIYAVRPIICRSHGAPIQYRDPQEKNSDRAERFRDACHLNFKTTALGELPAEDVLNLDTINTLLSLLNRQEFGKDETRFPLTLAGIEAS